MRTLFSAVEVEPEIFEISIMLDFTFFFFFEGKNLPGQMFTNRQYLLTKGSIDNNLMLSTTYYDFEFLSIHTFQLTCSR